MAKKKRKKTHILLLKSKFKLDHIFYKHLFLNLNLNLNFILFFRATLDHLSPSPVLIPLIISTCDFDSILRQRINTGPKERKGQMRVLISNFVFSNGERIALITGIRIRSFIRHDSLYDSYKLKFKIKVLLYHGIV